MKYRKKPIIIEAIKWNGLNISEIQEFCPMAKIEIHDAAWQVGKGVPRIEVTIPTLEGDMRCNKGDFIIKGVASEFYPCKPDIFMQTYEPVSG